MNDIEMRFDDNIIIGGAGEVQEKTVTPNAAGQVVRPDTGYDALSKVIVEGDNDLVANNIRQGVDVFGVTGNLEERLPEQVKTAIPVAAGVEVLPDAGKTLSRVNIPAEPNMVPGNIKDGVNIFGVVGNYDNRLPEQTKTVDAVPQGTEITPDSGKTLSKVIINAIANLIAGNIKRGVEILGITGTYETEIETQEKSATPGAQAVEVTPDAGKYLSKVTVQGDADLVAGNIKKNVEIFGVTGTYEGTETNFATFVEGTTGTIQIPAVTTIRNTCFQNQKHNYLIPGTVESIGDYAFDGCSGMTRLVLPAGLTSLGAYAFRNCKNIESDVIIPEAINDILGAVFYGCSKITRFEFKSTFTAAQYNRIQAYAFYNCSACLRYDFTAAEAVPELVNVNAFNGHNADLRIIVPDALYNDWIAATNWSNAGIKEHIVKASEA